MKSRDGKPSSAKHVGPHERVKTVQVGERTWSILCTMKDVTHSRSMDEVIYRLLQLHRRELQEQMSLFLEAARYDELRYSPVLDLIDSPEPRR